MKRIVLLLSHLGADSKVLYSVLNTHPQIDGFNYKIYDNIEVLENLTSNNHKLDNSSAIFLDRLLFNHQISDKKVYSLCKFIIFIRGQESISEIIKNEGVNVGSALRYYSYRLRRLAEISTQTDCLLFTWENLKDKNFKSIESFLSLNSSLKMNYSLRESKEINKKAKDRYEFYLRFISQ